MVLKCLAERHTSLALAPTAMTPILVDLAVHRPPVRKHLLSVLREAKRFHVRHTADSAQQALRNVQADPPDLLLLSTELPDAPWQQTLRHLCQADPSVPIVAVSHCSDVEHVAGLLTSGIAGCVAEDEPADDVLALLDTVARGNVQFSQCVLRKFAASRQPAPAPVELNERQREILHLLATSHDNKRIAAALLLSEGTVRNYVSALYRQIGVESRTEAVLWAWRHGIAQEA